MYEAVILAGGMGTRLKSVSGDTPKPMVSVAGQPFLYRLMQKLEADGCEHIVLSVGYRADFIISRLKQDQPVKIRVSFAVEQEPLGTGGAIKKAAGSIKSEQFIVLNGDSYSDVSFSDLINQAKNSAILISGVNIEDASRYGTLELTTDSTVIRLVEKGISGPGIINSGVYVVSRKDILSFPEDKFSFEIDFLGSFNGKFSAAVDYGYFIDIGIPEDYHRACEYFA